MEQVPATRSELIALHERSRSPGEAAISSTRSAPSLAELRRVAETVLAGDPVAWIDGRPVTLLSTWPVRERRPVAAVADPTAPLVTGQRVVDTFFPVALGGSATIRRLRHR